MDELSDAEIVRLSRADPHAFATIFERHFDALHRYLRRRAPTYLADDLVAETFVQAFRNLDRYDLSHVDARPWLYGIASNLLRQQFRREGREMRAFARSRVDPVQVAGPVEPAGAELAAALAELTDGERDVIFLYAWTDLGYDDIAAALEVPIGTVRSRLNRGRSKLRELLEDERRTPNEDNDARTELIDG